MILYSVLEWLDIRTYLLGIFIVLILTDFIRTRTPPNFPPGPWAPPFVGNILTFLNLKALDKAAEDYGNVYSLRVGPQRAVFVYGYKMVKEALIKQMDSFTDRARIPIFSQFLGIGIMMAGGYHWRMQNKFANFHMRHFGKGKETVEQVVQNETALLCEAVKEEKGPFDPQVLLHCAAANNLMTLIFGNRRDYSDEQFKNILHLSTDAIELSTTSEIKVYNMFPWLFKHLPGASTTILSHYVIITDFLKEEIRKHQENWDPANPRDYVDYYLAEIKKREEDPAAGFSLDTLLVCTLDLLEAGTEGVSLSTTWILLFLMKYPHVQRKVQEEIDRMIGQSRMPTWEDRPNLPYTEAVIHESQRMASVVPLTFNKKACQDTMLDGYFIPKGTTLNVNLLSVLRDQDEWEKPDTFYPEHFLDAEGNFRKRDAFMVYSAGRRICLGEQLARMELFLFITSLLQRFTFTPAEGTDLSYVDHHKAFLLNAIPR